MVPSWPLWNITAPPPRPGRPLGVGKQALPPPLLPLPVHHPVVGLVHLDPLAGHALQLCHSCSQLAVAAFRRTHFITIEVDDKCFLESERLSVIHTKHTFLSNIYKALSKIWPIIINGPIDSKLRISPLSFYFHSARSPEENSNSLFVFVGGFPSRSQKTLRPPFPPFGVTMTCCAVQWRGESLRGRCGPRRPLAQTKPQLFVFVFLFLCICIWESEREMWSEAPAHWD